MNKENKNRRDSPYYLRLSFRLWLLIILFLILTYEVCTWWTVSMDSSVYDFLMNNIHPDFTQLFIAFTNLWWTYWIIILAVLLTIVLWLKKENRKFAIISFLTPIIIMIINTVVKNIVQRPRPEILRLVSETWYSFPSWHTMHTVALYWLIMLLTSYFVKNRWLRRVIYLLSLLIILWVTSSRIYLWVHYFSDILWWFLLSLVYLFVIKHFFFTKKVA
jgi:undecaprenyl-diphosphatase